MIKGNKGEWSEFYAMLYLLAYKNLYAADENLEKMQQMFFPILKIMRDDEPGEHIDYVIKGAEKIEIFINDDHRKTMTTKEFEDEVKQLLRDIPAGSRSFEIPHGESFLNGIYLKRIAAPASNVTDMKLKLHDTNTGTDQEMGFSIKSYLGEPPTLLNASPATNFKFEITGLDESLVDNINSISSREKIRDRIKAIYDNGGELKFAKTINTVFSGNMMMIDSRMEEIISDLLLYSFKTNEMDFLKIIEYLEQENPLSYPRSGFYEHKVKQFLCAKALGMDPSKEWSGIDEANGGYIVVKSDGEVVAFHLYNRNQFEQYLLDNTKLERGSTSRHDYASIYKEGSKLFINLNLQIRFKKR